MSESKRLFRSTTNKKLCGVCGGIGEYFNMDPTIVRIIWLIITFAGGAGLLAYLICALIIPEESGIRNA